jgi:hypothetical protein
MLLLDLVHVFYNLIELERRFQGHLRSWSYATTRRWNWLALIEVEEAYMVFWVNTVDDVSDSVDK